MKLRHATPFATPLLAFAIAIAASSLATAQNGANTTTAQSERPATTAPNNQDAQIDAAQQQDREGEQETGPRVDDQESRGTAGNRRANTDCIDVDSGVAANAAGQQEGADNATRTPETIAQLPRGRDDCLDLIRNANGNANAQGEESDSTADSQTQDAED